MRGAFVVNKYYTDNGIEYVANRLGAELSARGHTLDITPCPSLFYTDECGLTFGKGFDFVLFWNKDYGVARAIENSGLRVFNSSRAIENSDDKAKTYLCLAGNAVSIPRTVVAPLVYDISEVADSGFIQKIEDYLGYPVIVKESVGSQSRQVYQAGTRAELTELHRSLLHIPHLFQQYAAGECVNDVRVFVVGNRAVAAFSRRQSGHNAPFAAEKFDASPEILAEAERISRILGLDYGSLEFLVGDETFVFIEADSNAYMFSVEKLGYNVAGAYADHIVTSLEGGRT